MQVIGERGVRIVPDVQVSTGTGTATGGLLDSLLSLQLRKAGVEKGAVAKASVVEAAHG